MNFSQSEIKDPFGLPTWGFQFESTFTQTAALADGFVSPDICMWKRDPGLVGIRFVFSSAHFNNARNNTELFDRAAALKAVFDGAMYLNSGPGYAPFSFSRLINNLTEKEHDCWEGSVLTEPFDASTLTQKVRRDFTPLGRFDPAQMVFMARYDSVALGILKHLGFNGPDFRTLYSLLDWLKTNGWNDNAKIAAAADMKADDVKRFTGTVWANTGLRSQ